MISFRRSDPAVHAAVEPKLFRDVMNRPAIARDLFLPMDQAWWDGGRLTLGPWAASAPRPSVRGIRLQEPRPQGGGPPPEVDTQGDLCTLVSSVAELRRVPQLAGLVLSEETLVGEQSGTVPGKRLLFGLRCPPSGQFDGETPGAAECHRVLRLAVKRAGYIVEHPAQPFNPTTGFDGLRTWAAAVRLRRKRSRKPWLLLLLLPLLFFPVQCLRSWHNSAVPSNPSDASDLAKSPGTLQDLEKLLQDDGSGKPPSAGGAGGGNGKPGTGGANQKGNTPPKPPTPPRQAASRATAEEAGPPTTIPSKITKPLPVTQDPRSRFYLARPVELPTTKPDGTR
jgi:hypothetical protein